jgi:hypothetical protein
LPELVNEAVVDAAEVVGNIYGGLTGYGLSADESRDWIASRLKELITAQREDGKITNEFLEKQLAAIRQFASTGGMEYADSAETRGVHVDLPESISMRELAQYAPLILAAALTLNTKLYINLHGSDKAARALESMFREEARKNGVQIGEQQFHVFAVLGEAFASLNSDEKLPADALLAADKRSLPQENEKYSLWFNSDHAKNDMEKLASEITETLYAALDPKTKGKVQDISTYSQRLSEAIVKAVQGYAAILKAA